MNNFLGEIQIFGFNFAPNGWAFCDGKLLPISQYAALYSLVGTVYGGDGRTTFGLPNLQGLAACATGRGTGLQPYALGENFGSETVALISNELAGHTHVANIFLQNDTTQRFALPTPGSSPVAPATATPFASSQTSNGSFAANFVGPNVGGQPHANQQPYLALNFCIALQGDFPQRP
ncbi:MAG TPA: tail fiber protein [Pinirhizobacter sp.]|uniref:phage tail protein n=1 Tax=Pinirhizobacter sp. TaxID=2950432 RepID=UPI002C3752A1|nr:tail fiber protein [Pinirhizobacter sp.]HMH67075.1 tail fiber protein [Pinirhizobacter sp.]